MAACVVCGGEDSEPLAEGERPCPPLAPLPLEGPRLPRDCWAQPWLSLPWGLVWPIKGHHAAEKQQGPARKDEVSA